MEKEQLYGVTLRDYSLPRYVEAVKLHLGTRKDFLDLADRLEGFDELNPYFRDLRNGILTYPNNPDARLTVGGTQYPVMIPMTEICRREVTLTDHMWIHKPQYSRNAYLMKAKSIWLTYILAEYEGRLFRAYKASFDCLAASMAGIGWICPGNDLRSFPGMSHYEHYGNTESEMTHFKLYVVEKAFPVGTNVEDAVNSMPGMLDVDLSAIVSATTGTLLS